jgi:hypothetical protein
MLRLTHGFRQQQPHAPLKTSLEPHSSQQPGDIQAINGQEQLQIMTSVIEDTSCSPVSLGKRRKKSEDMVLVQLTESREHASDDSPQGRASKVVYFGNDSIWSYTLQKARNSNPGHFTSPCSDSLQSSISNIHYKVPTTSENQPSDVWGEDFDLRQEEIKLLHKKGAFSLPPVHVQKALLDAYFYWLYPLQPILDKSQFLAEFTTGRISIVLLKAVLFVATTCCDENIVKLAWESRRAAQTTLYGHIIEIITN